MLEVLGNLINAVFTGTVLAAFGAVIGMGLSGLSSAKGLEISGNAAAGVTSEDEKNFTSALILEALPQTQCIYGFIVSVMILMGIMNGNMTLEKGLISLAAGIVVGLGGLTAIMQGQVSASCIGALGRNQKVGTRILIFIVMPEIAALLSFVTAMILLSSGKVF